MEFEEKVQRAIPVMKSLYGEKLDEQGRAYFIPASGSGRRFAITDIHGCFETFCRLLQKIDLQKTDQLFLLGDLVDRAPYSFYVLNKVVDLILDGYQVYCLRGNHEQIFIELNQHITAELFAFSKRQSSLHLLGKNYYLKPGVREFFEALPHYFETEKEFLVHAGFNVGLDNAFEDWRSMLWIRGFKYKSKKFKSKPVIHGHVPKIKKEIAFEVSAGRDICLDNGCVRAQVPGYGRLLCLDLDTLKLHSKKNSDLIPTL